MTLAEIYELEAKLIKLESQNAPKKEIAEIKRQIPIMRNHER